MNKPLILIATLMSERGFCGVQTHFNAIADYAKYDGYRAVVAEPHQVNRWVRRFPGAVGRLLKRIDPEKAVLWNRFFAFWFLRNRLRELLRSLGGDPVVIYAQDPLSARAAMHVRRQGFDFRLVTVLHFNVSEAYENQLNGLTHEGGMLWNALMRIERETLSRVDSLIFVSEYMRRLVVFRNPGLNTVEQRVIPNFPRKISRPEPLPIEVNGDIISIGTLEPRKNQGYLLHVLAEAKSMGYRYRLTLVGDGPSRADWEDLARRLGVAAQVSFLGYLPGASALLSRHRVYAHAAKMESFGIVLVEAMSHGLPVFAPHLGGMSEVFEDGVQGTAWPLTDAAECARVLVSVLEDDDTWRRMSHAALHRYQRHFAPEVLGPQWLSAIIGHDRPRGSAHDLVPELSQGG